MFLVIKLIKISFVQQGFAVLSNDIVAVPKII